MSLFFYLVLDFSNKNTNKFCVGFVVFLKMFTYFQKNYKTRAQFLFSFNWGGEALSPFVLTLLCVHDSRCKDVHIRVTKRCRWFQEGYLKCRFPLLKLKCQNVLSPGGTLLSRARRWSNCFYFPFYWCRKRYWGFQFQER